MSEAIQNFLNGIITARDDLNALSGHLLQLRELAQSAFLEDARANAANDPSQLEAYKQVLLEVYGIRIDDSLVPLTYDALWNYHQALEQFAAFLELVAFDQNVSMNDKYLLFLETMGNLTIVSTQADQLPTSPVNIQALALWCVEIDAEGKESTLGGCDIDCVDVVVDGSIQRIRRCKAPRAFTYGHTIYDITGPIYWKHEGGSLVADDIRDREYTNEMGVNNLVHELFHSLDSSSGFGQLGWSPLTLSNAESCMKAIVKASSLRQSTEDESTEIFADFGLIATINTALLSQECNGLSFDQIWTYVIQQAQLYHTPLTDRQTELGIDTAVTGTITGDRVGFRVIPDDSSDTYVIERLAAGTVVALLGFTNTATGRWYYSYRSNAAYHQYGWIFSGLVQPNGDTSSLPCLSASSTPEIRSDC